MKIQENWSFLFSVKTADITSPENEEEFYVGRLNYAKGVRFKYQK